MTLFRFLTRGASPLLLLALTALSSALACEDAVLDELRPAETFFEEGEEAIDVAAPDLLRLAEAVFLETNRRREAQDLAPLSPLPELFEAACLHARDMVTEGFFAHEHPHDEERATPADRVRLVGLSPRFVAENIAQAFLLRYEAGEAVYPREEDGEVVFARESGGPPIEAHSYASFAAALLDDWLASPGHREAIMSQSPSALGAACWPDGRSEEQGEGQGESQDEGQGESQGEMPVAVCVQVFFDGQ